MTLDEVKDDSFDLVRKLKLHMFRDRKELKLEIFL